MIAVLAAVVLAVAANAGLMGASRLSFNMGEYYQLPRFFYTIHPRFRTPIVSLLFFALLAAVVIIACQGRIDFLADLYNFGAMLAFFFAHLSLIAMRIKKPHIKRPFRAPLNLSFGAYSIPLTAIVGAIRNPRGVVPCRSDKTARALFGDSLDELWLIDVLSV